jgi:anti-anti-sigma factor
MSMTLNVEHRDRVAIVKATGELDGRTCTAVLDAVRTAQGRDPVTIIIDLSRVTFCDVAGLRAVQRSRRKVDGSLDNRVITVGSNATRRVSALLECAARRCPPAIADHNEAAA